jgi:NAD(P)-dependent dehydrogenase (short-subunit alcohol dehydrogenase family)
MLRTMIDLNQRTVLITGGLGAISEHILKALNACGATLVVTDIVTDLDARKMLKDWGLPKAQYYVLDICDPTVMESVLPKILTSHPNIDTCLGHAGGTKIDDFSECTRETFDRIVQFNFTAQTYLARAVLAHWTKQSIKGHLIFTSSYVSKIPMPGISAYVASKAGLEMFAKNLALEYAAQGIRVNCVSPGNVAAGSSKLMYDTDEVYRAWVDRVSPLGKRNSPEAIANAFIFLCSELANEIDGQIIQIDAGVGLPKLG